MSDVEIHKIFRNTLANSISHKMMRDMKVRYLKVNYNKSNESKKLQSNYIRSCNFNSGNYLFTTDTK